MGVELEVRLDEEGGSPHCFPFLKVDLPLEEE